MKGQNKHFVQYCITVAVSVLVLIASYLLLYYLADCYSDGFERFRSVIAMCAIEMIMLNIVITICLKNPSWSIIVFSAVLLAMLIFTIDIMKRFSADGNQWAFCGWLIAYTVSGLASIILILISRLSKKLMKGSDKAIECGPVWAEIFISISVLLIIIFGHVVPHTASMIMIAVSLFISIARHVFVVFKAISYIREAYNKANTQ